METKEKYQENSKAGKTEKKERIKEISKPLLVRQLGQNIMKAIQVGLLNEEEAKQMKELHQKAVAKYISGTLIA